MLRQTWTKGRISKRVLEQSTPNFPKIEHGVRNDRFSENLACFVFLKHLFWDSPFCLITDDFMWFGYVLATFLQWIQLTAVHVNLMKRCFCKCYGILGQVFGLISSFLCNRRLREVLDWKPSQEYSVNNGVPQGSITLFLLYINDFPDMLSVILLSMLMILLSALNVTSHLICCNN